MSKTETDCDARNENWVTMTTPMTPETICSLIQNHYRGKNIDERIVMLTPRDYEKEATIEVQATMWRRVRWEEETFLVYYYEYNNAWYYFGWNTPWDEFHRALGRAKDPEWYDDSKCDDTFTVKIVPDTPSHHWIDDALYGNMNDKVWYFGKRYVRIH